MVEGSTNLTREYWEAKFPSQIVGIVDGSLKGDKIYELTQTSLYQPPAQYRINFIKFVIKQLESRGEQGDDGEERNHNGTERWYESLESLSRAPVQLEPFYRLYDIHETGKPIKVYEDEKAFVSDGSTGFITWRASLELAKWLTIDQLLLTRRGSRSSNNNGNCCWAFELGCGTGLLAIAVMTKFPQHLSQYLATDVHNGVLARCEQNVQGNQLEDKIDTALLDWVRDEAKFSDLCQKSLDTFQQPGILLGADVIFDASVIPFLTNIIQRFLALEPRGRAFFSSAIRNEDTFEEFKRQLRDNRLTMEIVHEWGDKTGVILEVTKSDQVH